MLPFDDFYEGEQVLTAPKTSSPACKFCGWKEVRGHAKSGLSAVCYCCGLWLPRIVKRDDPGSIRVGGVHWTIGTENEYGLRHWPGKRHTFYLRDGRVLRTTNAKCQGAIPPHFQRLLPSNARLEVEDGQ